MVNKSQGYCGLHGNVGLILLNEVVLGKQFVITQDRPDLKQPPKGYDSVLAQGTVQPNPKDDYLECVFQFLLQLKLHTHSHQFFYQHQQNSVAKWPPCHHSYGQRLQHQRSFIFLAQRISWYVIFPCKIT